ncbi:hypothetical protein [Dawidia cretensis]|nr:hypothetical protein [Dawidia cretensis]
MIMKEVFGNHRATLRSYARHNPEWIYTLVFFALVILVYIQTFHVGENISDKQFVKEYFQKALPREQITLLNKFSKDEEFDLDRGWLIKGIHVNPQVSTGTTAEFSFLNIGRSFGVLEGDSALYLENSNRDWERVILPVKKTVRSNGVKGFSASFDMNFSHEILYDRSSMVLFHNEDQLAYCRDGEKKFTISHFSRNHLDKLSEYDRFIQFCYLGPAYIAGIGTDSVYFIPTDAALAAEILHVARPIGGHWMPSQDGIIFNSESTLRPFLYWLHPSGEYSTLATDNVLLELTKGHEFSWTVRDDIVVIEVSMQAKVGIIDLREEKPLLRIFQYRSSQFDRAPFPYRGQHRVFLIGETSGKQIGVARLALREQKDSIDVLPFPEVSGTHQFLQINDDGLTLGYGSDDPGLHNFDLYVLKNVSNKIETLATESLLDSALVNELSSFRIEIPEYSPEFSFIATNSRTIPVGFGVFLSRDRSDVTINRITDNRAQIPRSLSWPNYEFYKVDSTVDYFFIVIIIIGVIIIYFFGLFYILNYKNRNRPEEEFKAPVEAEIASLKEKVQYAKRTMQSLKLRSEIMLWLGIVVGVLGIFAFILSLKMFFKDTSNLEFNAGLLILLLRTFAVFGFMEVFCFYFLKQYRITFNEYKRFFSLYLRLMNYYQYMEMVRVFPNGAVYKEMQEAILKDTFSLHDETMTEKINEFEKTVVNDIVKTLSTKIPNP